LSWMRILRELSVLCR